MADEDSLCCVTLKLGLPKRLLKESVEKRKEDICQRVFWLDYYNLVCLSSDDCSFAKIYIYYSPDGRSVLGKTVPEDKKAGKIFPNTHRPWLVNNIFIFSKT